MDCVTLPFRRCLTVLFFYCLLIPFTSSAQHFKEDKITISGAIKNFDKEKNQHTVVFLINSAVNGTIKKTEVVDLGGKFKFESVIACPQDVVIQYDEISAEVFFRPGDRLNIELGGNPSFRIIEGDLARENRMIQEFLAERAAGKGYIKPKGASSLFEAWAADYTKYDAWSKLIKHYNTPGVTGDSISSFLSGYKMNELPVVSVPYIEFLSGLYSYFTRQADAGKSALFAQYAKERNFTGLGGLFSDHIKRKTKGLTKDLLFTMLYMDALNGEQLAEFKVLWSREPVFNPYLKKKIFEKSLELEAYLKKQQVKDASTLVQIGHTEGQSVLDSVVRRFPGKVIYADFWAPWCSPCMAAMPASKEVQQYYKNKDIVFVFFGNRCSDESWKATIANRELPGVHYNLSNDQYNLLASKFNINGIPHYLIIDKGGKVVNGNAPGPEQKESLKSELDLLLKQAVIGADKP
ncbi:Thiol-disulfide isomerase or thioredoxin [Pedobacter steynii]|uniref:Thiol-disulfide isomerase or thioredoxin n=2 Tax=Pedobacter steynii TaxID=430522 RepID=A0A1G9UKD7_9SPHI|nr:TlpA disulfide reductase family protein [Pedobacter steynii]NQX40794.1 redoxin family protein [Pedobacter steynii]SDM60356.1 Thiol-disulfide isomerase or thioredoxin [Pedobacter steynii]